MRGGGLLSCWQVDKTEIRRRMTLQIQAETLGRADQERRRSGGKQSTGARIYPERRNKSRRGVLDPYLVSSYLADSPATTQGRRPPLFPTKPESRWYASCDLVFGSKSTMNVSSAKVLRLRKARAKLKSKKKNTALPRWSRFQYRIVPRVDVTGESMKSEILKMLRCSFNGDDSVFLQDKRRSGSSLPFLL